MSRLPLILPIILLLGLGQCFLEKLASPLSLYLNTFDLLQESNDAAPNDTAPAPENNANLSSLVLSKGVLTPAFSPSTTEYTATVNFLNRSVNLTPTAASNESGIAVNSITVNDAVVASGEASEAFSLSPESSVNIAIHVTATDGSTRTYTVTVNRDSPDNFAQQAYIKASNAEADDHFGAASFSGDTLAVGAWTEDSNATGVDGDQDDNNATDSGAVYVFTRTDSVWTQQAYLKASNTGIDDVFGGDLAISGDTLVVAAINEDSDATGVNGDQNNNDRDWSGAAYVFTRTDSVWTQQAYIKASNAGSADGFTWITRISGDTILLSAWGEDSNATGVNGDESNNSRPGSGAVYVFTRTDSVWTQQAFIKASNPDLWDQFGNADISGDTIAVGATGEDSNATGVNGDQVDNNAEDSGAVYVFTRTNSVWAQQAYLKASNTEAEDRFVNVSISGDTIVVGARYEDSNATGVNGDQSDNSAEDSGAAYVFTRTGSVWTQQAYLKASNTGAGDEFGSNVVISGDTIVVSAPLEDSNATGVNGDQGDNSATDSGAAYVFTRTGSTWTQQTYLKALNGEASDGFGGVAISGDTIVVGSRGEDSNATDVNGDQGDNSATDSGAVYVFQ